MLDLGDPTKVIARLPDPILEPEAPYEVRGDHRLTVFPEGAVVLSDYAKGVLTPRLLGEIIAAANKAGVPVIVDPKAADYAVYRGATVIKSGKTVLG